MVGMKMYAIVAVPRGTPLVCSEELLKRRCRLWISKKGYTFTRTTTDEYGEEEEEEVTYTDDDKLRSAREGAEQEASRFSDGWCVDAETLEIIAAYRIHVEQLILISQNA